MPTNRKLNIALVGAGRRGAGAHLPVIAKLTDVFSLVAICDRDEATAHRLAAQHGVNHYTSVRELVAREHLDVADVIVPADAHHAICAFLAQAGVHVLVETPIAVTRPLADLMMEATARYGTKLEVAENYYRAPAERFKAEVIRSGVIGHVSRIYRIFYEGGYHGMSLIRHQAGGRPVGLLGVTHASSVLPHADRMRRRHTREQWALSVLDFDNGVLAVLAYSNIIHARSLGRGRGGISQIDGTEGTLVGEEVHIVPPEQVESGAVSHPYAPRRTYRDQNGVKVLEKIELDLPQSMVRWENPYAAYSLGEGQIAVADGLFSIARAVWEDRGPDYGAAAGRLDQEMNLATAESALSHRQTVRFPLSFPCRTEEQIHERFRAEYGRSPFEVDALVHVFYPRR